MPVSPYILSLRQHIGTDLLWLPAATAVILDDDGRLLLGQRSDNGRWALVGGILEPGEEPGLGVAREVFEETGVDVQVEALAAVTVTEPTAYPNGDQVQYLDLCFVCRPISPEAAAAARVNDDESLAVAWFAPDALPDGLHPETLRHLELTRKFMADPTTGPHFVR